MVVTMEKVESGLDSVRQAWRAARARRSHAAIVIFSIAAGIAANTIVFAVIDAAILRPFPFPEPERLVGIGAAYPHLNRPLEFFEALSGPEYVSIRDGASALRQATGFDLGNEPVMLGDRPERVFTGYFWADPFQVLGVGPSSGRSFTDEEIRTAAPVAIISHRLAQSIAGDASAIVGRPLRIGGRPHTVIGIIPSRVHLYDTDLWIPMREAAAALPQNRRQFNVIARVGAGREIDAVNAELSRVAAQLTATHASAHPEYADLRLEARPWSRIQVWGFGDVATISFLGVGGLLLLITANVANLLLAGVSERAREMAVRAALGATRGRLAVQMLLETMLLVFAGGAAGLLLSWIGMRAVSVWLGDFLPAGASLDVDGRVVLLALTLSAAAGLLVSLGPVAQLARTQPSALLAGGMSRAIGGRGTRRLQRTIVGFEVATGFVVTGAAMLLAVNVARVLTVHPGFPYEGILAMRITLPLPKYEQGRSMVFFDALLDRVRALPTVAEASVSNQPPPGVFSRAQFTIDGAAPAETLPSAFFTTAGPRYRETLGLELARGRWFDERAAHGGPREIVINEEAATRFFPGEDPIGRRMLIAPPHSDRAPTEVVGVVRSVRNRGLLPPPAPEIIGSVRQIPDRRQSQLYLVVRGRAGTDSLLGDVRGVMQGLDPEQPVYAVSTLASQYEAGVSARRAAAMLLGIFSALALGLAMLGIYGVVSRGVSSRRREIGVRAALGADGGALQMMVIADAMRPVLAGLLGGLAVLLAGQNILASWIYGVRPDATALLVSAALLSTAAVAASLLPAVHAGRIEPIEALRQE